MNIRPSDSGTDVVIVTWTSCLPDVASVVRPTAAALLGPKPVLVFHGARLKDGRLLLRPYGQRPDSGASDETHKSASFHKTCITP